MSWEYVEKRVKEALKLTGGNATRARQMVIAWTNEDSRLLQGLAQPHLTGIVAHAVSRVINKKEQPEVIPPTPQEEEDPAHEFGMQILRTIASGSTAQFGLEGAERPQKKQAASQRHIDAIRQLTGRKNSGDTK